MNTLWIILISLLVLAAIGYVVFGGNSTTQTASTASESYSLEISNFAFNPQNLSIKAGDSVTWTNKDSATHTITSDSGNGLNSNSLGTGETYSYTFTVPGTYPYHCKFHPGMTGTITVLEVGYNQNTIVTTIPYDSNATTTPIETSSGSGLCPDEVVPVRGFWCPKREGSCLANTVFSGWATQGSCNVTYATCYYSNTAHWYDSNRKVVPVSFYETPDRRTWDCSNGAESTPDQDLACQKAMKVACGACTGNYGDVC